MLYHRAREYEQAQDRQEVLMLQDQGHNQDQEIQDRAMLSQQLEDQHSTTVYVYVYVYYVYAYVVVIMHVCITAPRGSPCEPVRVRWPLRRGEAAQHNTAACVHIREYTCICVYTYIYIYIHV